MTISVRSYLVAGVAVVTASVVVVASSVRPPVPNVVASPAIRVSVAVQPLTTQSDNIASLADEIRMGIVASLGAPVPTPSIPGPSPQPLTTQSDNIPSLADEIRMGIVPSLGAPVPTPNIPGPSPAPTDFNSLIKNTYNALEPWVQYGFELATYAVGWIPWVGWLAPQIMIFYFFGERIARSDVWNLDDWLWGPLPFVQGWLNNASDKWDAVVQLGIDQWNFWLPNVPLPPVLSAFQQTTALAANGTAAQQQPGQRLADVLQSLSRRLGRPDRPAKTTTGAAAGTAHGPVAHVLQALGHVGTAVASTSTAVTASAEDMTAAVPSGVTSAPDRNPTTTAALKTVLKAARQSADAVVAPRGELHATVTKFTGAATAAPPGKATHAAAAGGLAPATIAGALRDSVGKRSAAQRSPGGEVAAAH
jgi:hypothetical protein